MTMIIVKLKLYSCCSYRLIHPVEVAMVVAHTEPVQQ